MDYAFGFPILKCLKWTRENRIWNSMPQLRYIIIYWIDTLYDRQPCHWFPSIQNTVIQKREAIWRKRQSRQTLLVQHLFTWLWHLWHNDWLASQAKLTISLMVNLRWIRTRQGTARIEKTNRERENTEVNGHLGVGKCIKKSKKIKRICIGGPCNRGGKSLVRLRPTETRSCCTAVCFASGYLSRGRAHVRTGDGPALRTSGAASNHGGGTRPVHEQSDLTCWNTYGGKSKEKQTNTLTCTNGHCTWTQYVIRLAKGFLGYVYICKAWAILQKVKKTQLPK